MEFNGNPWVQLTIYQRRIKKRAAQKSTQKTLQKDKSKYLHGWTNQTHGMHSSKLKTAAGHGFSSGFTLPEFAYENVIHNVH